jgi:hypothetical protein
LRVELLLLAIPLLIYRGLLAALPPAAAGSLVAVSLVLLLAVPRTRQRIVGSLVRAHWRRRVERALAQLAGRCFGGVTPRIRGVARSGYAIHVGIRLRPGHAPLHVEQASEHLAVALRVREVRVRREDNDTSIVYLTCVRRDASAGPPVASPLAEVPRTNLWQPVPIGLDEAGRIVSVSLAERSVLVGGTPGAGKSNLLNQVGAFVALDPSATLFCLDGKALELSRYAPLAAGFAGPDPVEGLAVLREVDAEMGRRYARLNEGTGRKITRDGELSLLVVLVDEVSAYLTGDRKQVGEFTDLLHRLVTRGRAAGVVVVLATQKPSADVIPTAIRDNVTYRCALRTMTKEASDCILGGGLASDGYSATKIDPGTPGVCWLLAEGSVPTKVRCFHLDDEALDAVVAGAKALRA